MALSPNLIHLLPDADVTPQKRQNAAKTARKGTDTQSDEKMQERAVLFDYTPFQQTTVKTLIRGKFDPDGDAFPADLTDEERAQITAEWWLEDFERSARIELRKEIRLAFARDPLPAEYDALAFAIVVARVDGKLPRDLNIANKVFHEIKAEING